MPVGYPGRGRETCAANPNHDQARLVDYVKKKKKGGNGFVPIYALSD